MRAVDREVLGIVAAHWRDYGHSPSLMEIGEAFESSNRWAWDAVQRLVEAGALSNARPNSHRALRLTEIGWRELGEDFEDREIVAYAQAVEHARWARAQGQTPLDVVREVDWSGAGGDLTWGDAICSMARAAME